MIEDVQRLCLVHGLAEHEGDLLLLTLRHAYVEAETGEGVQWRAEEVVVHNLAPFAHQGMEGNGAFED